MDHILFKIVSRFLMFILFFQLPAKAQDNFEYSDSTSLESPTVEGGDEDSDQIIENHYKEEEVEDSLAEPPDESTAEPIEESHIDDAKTIVTESEASHESTQENDSTFGSNTGAFENQLSSTVDSNQERSSYRTAIFKGVTLTAEPGDQPDEKIITGYFIFQNVPSSYSYEIDFHEKKLIFAFNDTRIDTSPIPTSSEDPIKGFIIEQSKTDVNKAEKDLKPEWHDHIRVLFDLEAVPDIRVNDEYVIYFVFKWSSNPDRKAKYQMKSIIKKKKILRSSVNIGGIALGVLGVLGYFYLREDPSEPDEGPLANDDLPERKF